MSRSFAPIAYAVAVLFVSAYGIFLFFYKLGTGSFIEIPYLTVNAGDLGELEGKSIDRGGIFKLISTYNNGNVYGISILILLPLYAHLEKRLSRVLTVKASLVFLRRFAEADETAWEAAWTKAHVDHDVGVMRVDAERNPA